MIRLSQAGHGPTQCPGRSHELQVGPVTVPSLGGIRVIIESSSANQVLII